MAVQRKCTLCLQAHRQLIWKGGVGTKVRDVGDCNVGKNGRNFRAKPFGYYGNTFCKYKDTLQSQLEVVDEITDTCVRIGISLCDTLRRI